MIGKEDQAPKSTIHQGDQTHAQRVGPLRERHAGPRPGARRSWRPTMADECHAGDDDEGRDPVERTSLPLALVEGDLHAPRRRRRAGRCPSSRSGSTAADVRGSKTNCCIMTNAMTPTGTLMKKTQRHV